MNAIELKLLRNAEYLQYVKDYLAIINLNTPEQLGIDAKLAILTTKATELEALYKKALANDKTQELLLLDERRDDALKGIYYFLLGYTYHFEADQQQKAQLLLTNMELYGSGISRLNYQKQLRSTIFSAIGKTNLSLQMPLLHSIFLHGLLN